MTRARSLIVPVGLSSVLVVMLWCFATQHRQHVNGTIKSAVLTEGDGHYMYLWLRSIAMDGDIHLANEYRLYGNSWGYRVDRDGRTNNVFPAGPGLLRIPFFWLGRGYIRVANLFGAEIATHGYTVTDNLFAFLSTCLAGFLVLVFAAWTLLRWGVHSVVVLTAAIVGLFGTNLYYYSTWQASYGHAFAACGIAGLLWLWFSRRRRETLSYWLLAGFAIGVAALSRLQEILWLLLPAIEVIILASTAIKNGNPNQAVQWCMRGLACLVVCITLVLPHFYINAFNFGSPFAIPQGADFMRWHDSKFFAVLFSKNGLISTHPITLAMLGLVCVPREFRWRALGVLVMGIIATYVNGCVRDWWGGAAFGQRRMLTFAFVWIVGFGLIAQRLFDLRLKERRIGVTAFISLVALCALLTIESVHRGYYRDRRTPRPFTIVVWR